MKQSEYYRFVSQRTVNETKKEEYKKDIKDMSGYRKGKNMRVFLRISLLLASIVILSFSKTIYGQSEDKSERSNSVVYFYRYKQFIGYTVEPSVYYNEVQLARMDNGRYFKVVLNPGKYTFRSNDKQSGIEMELKSGEEYYIRVEIVQGLWSQKGRLVLMAKEQGAYEIKKLKPLSKSKIRDDKKVVIDEQQMNQPQ